MLRGALLVLLLAACAGPELPDLGSPPEAPAPQLLPTDVVLAAAGANRIAPADDAALAARASDLQARAARLAATPVEGPPVP